MIALTRTEGATKDTISWAPISGAIGFKFTVDGKVSHTWDPTRTSVNVSKEADRVVVEAIGVKDTGVWPSAPPPDPGVPIFNGWYTQPLSVWDWGLQGSYLTVEDDPTVGKRGRLALPANANHTELLRARRVPTGGVGLGTTEFFGMAFMFPTGWQEPSPAAWGDAICQINYTRLAGINMGLCAHADNVQIVLNTGAITYTSSTPQDGKQVFEYNNADDPGGPWPNAPRAIPPSRFQLNKWHYLILEIKWDTGWAGRVVVNHLIEGETGWTKTVDVQNVPTLGWGKAISYNTDRLEMTVDAKRGPQMSNPGAPYDQSCDKFGTYRGPAAYPLTFYNARFAIDRTFESAAARIVS